jgi:hypothetical protein
LSVVGFPSSTFPGILDELNRLAFPYRWVTRAICLDKTEATKLLGRIRRQWFAKRKNVIAILKEVLTNEASTLVDTDAANKPRRRRGAAGTRRRHGRPRLCHRHRDRLARGPARRGRSAPADREGHPGPRLHHHHRRRERGRGVARKPSRSPLRQRPPAADLDHQPAPHDPALGGVGGA